MDRVCFVPYERLKLNAVTADGWMHMDQSRRHRRGTLECVQGLVTLNDIGAGEVALEVFEGAHRYHKLFFEQCMPLDSEEEKAANKRDWCRLSAEQKQWYLQQKGVKQVRVHAKAGSLILWDSRLPHHAMPPRDNSQRSKVDRSVIYSCMVPRSWATPKILKKRIKAFENGRATSHWPQDGNTFQYKPRTYSSDIELFESDFDPQERQLKFLPTQTTNYPLLRRLVGYEQ
jgi:ectoine hydroxylase-related dioxygenase (phytanoyl-CoA dioxygenase family)